MKEKKIISVGGIGGSGTRVISKILKDIGYYTGGDLNVSEDNLLFTLLFKRQNILTASEDEFESCVNIFVKLMSGAEPLNENEKKLIESLAKNERTLHTKEWLEQRVQNIKSNKETKDWAWKEPNTHIVIEHLFRQIKNLKFVYVYRNGLDMAYSTNQNQLKLWGSIFFNDYDLEVNPQNSLRYWCLTHKRMLKLKEKFTPNVMMLDFDRLCFYPNEVLSELFDFIGCELETKPYAELVNVPNSIGRHKEYSLEEFDSNDLSFISKIYE